MILAVTSLFLALFIAFGRQSAVFGKIKSAIWFFSYFEIKRLIISMLSLFLGGLAIYLNPGASILWWIFACSVLLILSAFLFDFKYIFPEVNLVEKEFGKKVDIVDKTEIIGIKVEGKALAYPIDVLMTRHIINDKVNNEGILLSYCAICRSGLVFSSEIDNEVLYFKVSGVWRRNMLMVDNKTQSIWQQATGECVYGKYKGRKLKLIMSENTNWGTWLKNNPNSFFAIKCIEARKGYLSVESMMKGLEFATTKMTPPGFTNLKGLPTRETVFGIEFNGISKAYPLKELGTSIEFLDNFGSVAVKLSFNIDYNHLQAINMESGKNILVQKHWWLGWKEFHPETLIWKKATHSF